MIQKALWLFCFFFVSQLSQAGNCGLGDIKVKLESIGFRTDAVNNKQFLVEVEYRYGKDVKDALLKEHPALQSDKAALSLDTIDWTLKKIDEFNLPRYLYSPFNNNFDVLIKELFSTYVQKEPGVWPVFADSNQFEHFKAQLLQERDLNILIFSKSHNLSDANATALYDDFLGKYTGKHYVKFTNDNHKNPMVHIIGHGAAGDDAIYSGAGSKLFTFELLDKLKRMNISQTATIKLDFCWSACQFMPSNITKARAVQLIESNDFATLFGGLDNSFYDTFISEIPEYLPGFRGNVFGYRGAAMMSLKDGVFSISGEQGRYYSVELTLSDGNILFKKDDMSVSSSIQ
ncbi:hypothetical protein ACET9P_22095 [Aeromonas veronii]